VNEVHYTIAAPVIIPGVIAAGVFIIPTKEEIEAQRINAHQKNCKNRKNRKLPA